MHHVPSAVQRSHRDCGATCATLAASEKADRRISASKRSELGEASDATLAALPEIRQHYPFV